MRLGWDTSDELRARMLGWRTQSFSVPSGDPIHLRPTATQDGAARGHRRNGVAAYSYGAAPAWVILGVARRVCDRPRVVGGLNYLVGWLTAAIRSYPRVPKALKATAIRLAIRIGAVRFSAANSERIEK